MGSSYSIINDTDKDVYINNCLCSAAVDMIGFDSILNLIAAEKICQSANNVHKHKSLVRAISPGTS